MSLDFDAWLADNAGYCSRLRARLSRQACFDNRAGERAVVLCKNCPGLSEVCKPAQTSKVKKTVKEVNEMLVTKTPEWPRFAALINVETFDDMCDAVVILHSSAVLALETYFASGHVSKIMGKILSHYKLQGKSTFAAIKDSPKAEPQAAPVPEAPVSVTSVDTVDLAPIPPVEAQSVEGAQPFSLKSLKEGLVSRSEVIAESERQAKALFRTEDYDRISYRMVDPALVPAGGQEAVLAKVPLPALLAEVTRRFDLIGSSLGGM